MKIMEDMKRRASPGDLVARRPAARTSSSSTNRMKRRMPFGIRERFVRMVELFDVPATLVAQASLRVSVRPPCLREN